MALGSLHARPSQVAHLATDTIAIAMIMMVLLLILVTTITTSMSHAIIASIQCP